MRGGPSTARSATYAGHTTTRTGLCTGLRTALRTGLHPALRTDLLEARTILRAALGGSPLHTGGRRGLPVRGVVRELIAGQHVLRVLLVVCAIACGTAWPTIARGRSTSAQTSPAEPPTTASQTSESPTTPPPAMDAQDRASPPGTGAMPQERFRQAGTAYEAGRYADAAAIYQGLLDAGYDDARVHYNLGNARFKEGKIGLAILGYERALVRNPSDADAKENLAYASLLTTDKVGTREEDLPARVLAGLEEGFGWRRAMAVLAISSLMAGLIAIPLWFSPPPSVRVVLWAGVGLALVVASLSGAAAAVQTLVPAHETHAIVLASSTDGRSSPSLDGTVLFTVHEGLKVEIRGERPGWLQVALPNAFTGWIEASGAEKI